MFPTMIARPQGLFDQIENFQRLLARATGVEGLPEAIRSAGYGTFPEINVGRTPSSIEVFAFAPGIDADSLEVTIERNVLKLAGNRTSGIPPRDGKVHLYVNERPEGGFSRAITLPEDIDSLNVEAKYRDGILRISVALNAATQPQRIAVQ